MQIRVAPPKPFLRRKTWFIDTPCAREMPAIGIADGTVGFPIEVDEAVGVDHQDGFIVSQTSLPGGEICGLAQIVWKITDTFGCTFYAHVGHVTDKLHRLIVLRPHLIKDGADIFVHPDRPDIDSQRTDIIVGQASKRYSHALTFSNPVVR